MKEKSVQLSNDLNAQGGKPCCVCAFYRQQ